jgi:hypothetical protein
MRGGSVFPKLTDELLELTAADKGYGHALYAQFEIHLCCSFCCSCSCE